MRFLRAVYITLFSAMFIAPCECRAMEPLHGVVMSLDTAQHRLLIRHEAFDGMPAMTMPFQVERSVILPPVGTEVRGEVDTTREPWTLEHFRVVRAVSAPPKPRAVASALPNGAAVPNVGLIDQDGKPYSLAGHADEIELVSFIYTRCKDPSMCPFISAKYAQLQSRLPARVHLIEITLDPVYDTPARLRSYAGRFHADLRHWTLLTGEPQRIMTLAQQLGIDVVGEPKPGTIIHSDALLYIGRDGKIIEHVDNADWTVDSAAQAARRIDASSSNTLRPWLIAVPIVIFILLARLYTAKKTAKRARS